ncbi:hypothetical protein AZE42_10555 [Rhizopogon vesiculosus]|uniref:Uncharacterized protein n=1 Tax=Rhizopogon vesiculosus TaxID=180088 RepID=A0A1J8QQK7_9AGAM|nr:hypothetical protein AZE42_10555 [Rhizopogon vesiculosus]
MSGDDFWGDNTNRSHRSAPSTYPLPRRRNLFDFLRFDVRPVDAAQVMPLQPRRWNASLIPVRISRHRVDVAPCRPPDIYGMAPIPETEVVAAMQHVTGNEANGSAQPGGTAVGIQRPQQAPPTQTPQVQTFGAGTDESVIGCCGFYLVHRRS